MGGARSGAANLILLFCRSLRSFKCTSQFDNRMYISQMQTCRRDDVNWETKNKKTWKLRRKHSFCVYVCEYIWCWMQFVTHEMFLYFHILPPFQRIYFVIYFFFLSFLFHLLLLFGWLAGFIRVASYIVSYSFLSLYVCVFFYVFVGACRYICIYIFILLFLCAFPVRPLNLCSAWCWVRMRACACRGLHSHITWLVTGSAGNESNETNHVIIIFYSYVIYCICTYSFCMFSFYSLVHSVVIVKFYGYSFIIITIRYYIYLSLKINNMKNMRSFTSNIHGKIRIHKWMGRNGQCISVWFRTKNIVLMSYMSLLVAIIIFSWKTRSKNDGNGRKRRQPP